MIKYIQTPVRTLNLTEGEIHSFVNQSSDSNIDWNTVESFGEEWEKFSDFSNKEIDDIGNDYFDIVPAGLLENATVLDVGCGSGRWSKYLSSRVEFIEAIDPSTAVISAQKMLSETKNVRVSQASVESIPFSPNSFDLVISLGVLHHIPNTQNALNLVVKQVKKGGACLIYLYYNLDNRGILYRNLFLLANFFRKLIIKLPSRLKKLVCDIIALVVYLPLSRFSKFLKWILRNNLYKKIPLSYYHDKSMNVIRNDSLDRFGTPLEQRFSKNEIERMMINAGLDNISFSQKAPFWHAIGFKS